MSTLTDLVASVVLHSSAAAFSHFGVQVDPNLLDRPAPAERVVNRTRSGKPEKVSAKAVETPETRRAPAANAPAVKA
jgi:hypothetical protein